MGGGAINGSDRGADRNLRHPAAGRSQRAAGSHFQHDRGRQADLVGERRRAAGVIVLLRNGTGCDLQCLAYGARGTDLSGAVVAARASRQLVSNTASAAESTGVR
jgi:hypothetical protein